MRLQVKGKNVEVSEAIRTYAEEKLGRLERQLADPTRVELELAVEKNPSIADNHVAEATIWTKGPVLRAKEASTDMRASIDLLVDKLERQVVRYKEKRRDRRGHGPGKLSAPEAPMPLDGEVEEIEPLIVKTKRFALRAMTPEEAVLELDLIGHDFFLFRNRETDDINVVYRRNDGGYGLIEPVREGALVGLFRRREPLHEQLAREGGLTAEPLREVAPPGWMETGIHGVHRAREWDSVVTVDVEGVEGDRVRVRRAARRHAPDRGGLECRAARRRSRRGGCPAVPG